MEWIGCLWTASRAAALKEKGVSLDKAALVAAGYPARAEEEQKQIPYGDENKKSREMTARRAQAAS